MYKYILMRVKVLTIMPTRNSEQLLEAIDRVWEWELSGQIGNYKHFGLRKILPHLVLGLYLEVTRIKR